MGFLKKYLKYWFLVVLTLAAFFVWSAVQAESQREMLVAFLDVGQGDAIFIEKSGKQVLIDSGPNKQVLGELSKLMPFYDRSIDMLIATHPDADHIGGFPAVLENFKTEIIMESGAKSESAVYQELERLIQEKEIEKVLARRGMRIIVDNNASLFVLFPDRDVSGLTSNDASIIAKLVYGNNSFLFTGDSPKKMENYLVFLDGQGLKSDVLKVGHHGSKTSSAEDFLKTVSPQYAVISAGKDNRYSHPHQEVLDALSNFGFKILRTDELGAIKMKSNGEEIKLIQ